MPRSRSRSPAGRYSSSSKKPSSRRRDYSSESESSLGRRRHSSKKSSSRKDKDEDRYSKKISKSVSNGSRESSKTNYTAITNPVQDSDLKSPFLWHKKKERDKKMGVGNQDQRLRREENRLELDKLNQRRVQREKEHEMLEEEQRRMQREADLAQLGDWETKESQFHLEQAKRRAEIRIRNHNPKPVDVLAMNLRLAEPDAELLYEDDAGYEVELDKPYAIFKNLSLKEVEELHSDICMYLELEKLQTNLEFWRVMMVVCDETLADMKAQNDPIGSRQSYIPAGVANDINALLDGKSFSELVKLQQDIQRKLQSSVAVDTEYWDRLLRAIAVCQAKLRLDDMHKALLSIRIERLRERQREQGREAVMEMEKAAGSRVPSLSLTSSQAVMQSEEGPKSGLRYEQEEYQACLSPKPFQHLDRDDKNLPVFSLEIDLQNLIAARKEVMSKRFVPRRAQNFELEPVPEASSLSATFFDDEIRGGGGDESGEDEIFATEATIAKTSYIWQDKYRPRKPRYLNRVHTGFEWNKYNQTHYDHDNPPPKVVQGYKFNIFYPDLIDRSNAPTYKIERDGDSDETCIIRFVSGPPYEDIAFRIVRREWEYSHKQGFRSSFDRGVLQLHFSFRRHFYRR